MANDAAVGSGRDFQAEEDRLRNGKKWRGLIQLYRERAEVLQEPGRERMLYKAGEVATDQLDDSKLAEELFLASFKVRSSFLPAIGALKVLHSNTKNTAGLMQILQFELEITTDGRRRGQLLTERAGLLTKNSPEEALAAYSEAIRVYPKSRLPLEPLEALAKKLKSFEPLVEAYRDLAAVAKPQQAAVYHFLCGMCLDEQLKDRPGAAAAMNLSLDSGAAEPRILTAIARHFEKTKDWTSLAKAIWQHLELVKDDAERGRLLKKQAWVHEVQLKQPERAQRLLQKALPLTPKDAALIKSLFEVSTALKDPKGIAQALEHEADLPTLSKKEKGERLERAAEARDRAKQGKKAFTNIKKSLTLRPKHPKSLKLLERITRRLGNWKEHAGALDLEFELLRPERSETEKKAALVILTRLAEVAETKLSDPARATEALKKLVALSPSDDAAWARLDTLARTAEDWTAVCDLLVRRIQVAQADEAKLTALRELADLQRDKLKDLDAAAETLEVLLQLAPKDVDALSTLCGVYQNSKKWELLAGTLSQLVDCLDEPVRKAGVLRQQADVQLKQLSLAADAKECLNEALALEAEGPGALSAWKLMAQAAEALEDDALLREALDGVRRFELDPEGLRWARIQLAKVDERAGNTGGALSVLTEILAEVPGDTDALPVVVRLLKQEKRFDDAAQRLEDAGMALEHEPERASDVYAELGALIDEHLDDVPRAGDAWEKALRFRPENADAFTHAAARMSAQKKHRELFDLLDDVAPRVDSDELRHRMWREQTTLAAETLDDPKSAAAIHERLLLELPADPTSTTALRSLYAKSESWPELAKLLEDAVQTKVKGLDTDGCLRELAQVAAERLSDLPRAADALELLVKTIKDPADPAWEQLADLYGRLQRHGDQVRILEQTAKLAKGDAALRTQTLVKAAKVYEGRVRDFESAAKALEKALKASPGVPELLLHLARVHRAAGDFDRASKVLEKAASAVETAGDPKDASDLLVERGKLLEENLGDPKGAEEAYRRAVTTHPPNGEAHSALIDLLVALGRHEQLAEALANASVLTEGEDKAQFLVQRAQILASRLGKLDDALETLDAAEAARPALASCRQARVNALRLAQRPQQLADALAARREADPPELDTDQSLALYRDEAEIRAFQLEELEPARALLLKAVSLRTDDLDTLRSLLRVERQLTLGVPLALHLVATASIEPDDARRANLLVEAGRVFKTRANDPERAKAPLKAALSVDPNRIEAVRWLSAIAREQGDRAANASWTEREAELESNGERRAELLVRLGRLLRREKPKAAVSAFERALKEDADNLHALRGLAPLFRHAKNYKQLATILERLAEVEHDARFRTQRLVTLGELRLQALNDAPKAREAFAKALELQPGLLRALKGHSRTFDEKEQPKELVTALRAELAASALAERRVALAKKIADLQANRLNDSKAATETLEEILRLRPLDTDAWRRLRDLHVQLGDYDALAHSYEREARHAPAVKRQETCYRSAAQIVEHHIKDKRRAATLYQEVLVRGDPECLAVKVLPAMLEELGDEDAYERALRRTPEIVPRTRLAAKALLTLGRRLAKRDEPAAAVRDLEAALEQDPECVPALDLLATIHEEQSESTLLVGALQRKRDLLGVSPEVIDLHLRIAKLLEDALHDHQGALEELVAAAKKGRAAKPAKLRTILRELQRLSHRCKRYSEQTEALGALAELSKEPEKAAKTLIQRARVEQNELANPRAAIVSYQAAFAKHNDEASLGPLVELLESEEVWEELVMSLEDRARLSTDGSGKIASLTRAALVLDQHLERPDDAIQLWEQILDLDPDREEAFKTLDAICTRTKNKRAHARACEREITSLIAKAPEDADARERLVACALKAADLYDALRLANRAVSVLDGAMVATQADRRLFDRLDALYASSNDFPKLFELLKTRAEQSEDLAERSTLHQRLAKLAADEIVDPEAELLHWEQVLVAEPYNPDATRALQGIYAGAGDWEALARVMRADVEARAGRAAAGDQSAKEGVADLYLALGEVLESKLNRRDEAAWAYSEATVHAPGDMRALRGLERIHLAEQAWKDLIRVRQALRDQEPDADERAKLALRIADAFDRLELRKEAITALRKALEEAPDDVGVLGRLRRYLLDEKRYEEGVEILSREADAVTERAVEFERRMERATILRDHLKRPFEAVEELEKARGLAPQDTAPLLALAPLYEAAKNLPKRVEVLEARANLEEDDALSADLYVEAAALNAKDLPADASSSYERALRRDPLRAEPLDALVPLYERQERWSDAARTLHRRAELARAVQEDPSPWLLKASELEETRLESKSLAATTLERLLEDASEDDGALATLARLRGELGQHASREVVLGKRAALAKGAAQRELLLERAKILDGELGRPAAAAQCVRAALLNLAEEPKADRAKVRELAGEFMRLCEFADDPPGLLDAAELALKHARDAGDETSLLQLVGKLTSSTVYRPSRAIEVYNALCERSDRDAIAALESLYRRESRSTELAELWTREIARLSKAGATEDVRRLLYQQADLYRSVLRQPKAAEANYKQILAGDPDQTEARDGLEAVYRAEQMQPELAALLAERATRAKSDGEAAQAYAEEAAVHEELGDLDTAISRLETGLQRAQKPGVSEELRGRILRTLIRHYRGQRRFDYLAKALEAFANEKALTGPERATVLAELGGVLSRDLGKQADGAAAFENALRQDPRNVPAARALAALYLKEERWEDVIGVYEREAEAKVDKGRLVWLKNHIAALQHELGKSDAAQESYRAALALDKKSLVALRGMVTVSRELGDAVHLSQSLGALAELAPSRVDRLEARRELAEVYQDDLEDLPKSVANWKQVVADAPDDLPALQGLAKGLRGLGDPLELVKTLEHELELTHDDARKLELSLEAAQLREQLADAQKKQDSKRALLELALAHAHRASELDPSQTDPIAAYARVAEKLGRWKELADATCRMARSIDDTKRCGWMYRRAAKVRSLRLGDAKGAAEAYLEAVRVNSSDGEAWDALEPIARDLGDDPLILRVLEKRLQLAATPAKKADVALKLGLQLIRMRQLPRAVDALVLAKTHGRGPLKARVLEQLEVAYRASERWPELCDVLGERARSNPPNARELLVERADVLEKRLGRRDEAILVYQRLREQDPNDTTLNRQLERLLSSASRWTDLVEMYESDAKRLGRSGYEPLVLLGRVARDKLDDPELAAQALQRAVTLRPAGLDALENLKSLYTRTESWPELLDTLRLEVGLLKDKATKEKRLRHAAQLAEDKLGDLLTAERFYKDIVSLAPHDLTAAASLARVQEARGEFKGLVESIDKQLALTKDKRDALRLHKQKGWVLDKKLNHPYDALAAYREALSLDASDVASLEAMTDLLRTQAEWTQLIEILNHRLKTLKGDAAVALSLELALIQAKRLGNPESAVKAAQQALLNDPECADAYTLQVEIYREWNPGGKNNDDLALALRQVANLSSGRKRADLFVELGNLYRDVLKNDKAALDAYEGAFKADHSHPEALDNMAPFFKKANRWGELIEAYEAGAKASQGFRVGELLAHAADLKDERLGDTQGAEADFRAALKVAPTHLPALSGLARVLLARGAAAPGADRNLAAEATQVLQVVAQNSPDPADQAQALLRAGDVFRDALEMYPQARQCYELAHARAPLAPETLASLAEMAFGAQDNVNALKFLNQVASAPEKLNDPARVAELLWARGQCLESLGRNQEACESYRQALKHRPTHLQALEDLARLLLGSEAWEAAKPVVEELAKQTRSPKIRASHILALAKVCGALKKTDKAIRLYQEALEQLPHRFSAHLELAELLREKDPKAAKKHYEYVLGGDDETPASDRADARIALGSLCEVQFKDPDAAAGHLAAAIELPGGHRAKACKHLAEIHGRAGRWEDALHNLKRATEFESDPKARADLHGNLARVLRDRLKKPELARRCFEKALELNPEDPKTLDSLLRVLEAAGDVDAQIRALDIAANSAQRSASGDEATLRLRRAEAMLRRKLTVDAVQEYERVLVIDPAHSGARASLSKLYLETGDTTGLERIHRALLAEDPLLVSSYQALSRGWRRPRPDARAQAAQVLSALGAARDAEDRKLISSLSDRMPRTKSRISEDDFVSGIVHERARTALFELLRKAGHHLLKQVPDDLKKHGIGWRTPRHSIEGNAFPEHALVKRICDVLGIAELDIYWMPEWKSPEPIVGHSKGSPALILCPEVFSNLSEAEKAFVVGKALGPLKLNLELFRALPPQQAGKLVLGALKGFAPAERSFPGDDEKSVRAVTKAISKDSELQSALTNTQLGLWRRKDELDFDSYRQGVMLTASRVGLLVAGGMHAASKAIVATNMSLRGRIPKNTEGVVKVFREIPELKDLCAYAVSEGYLRLRERSLRDL